MNEVPWDILRPVIETGDETQKVELKESWDLSSRVAKAEFAKNAAAIANTAGETGYIVIGVVDARRRNRISDPSEYIRGFSCEDPDRLQRQMVDTIAYFIEPPFEVLYRQTPYPETGTILGIVIIPGSRCRPHVVKNDGQGIHTGQIWVRRSSQVALASRQEIIEMCEDIWRPRLDDEIRLLQETYRGIDRDAVDFRRIAESASRRLYHTLSRKTRRRVVGRILADHGRGELLEEWFGVE